MQWFRKLLPKREFRDGEESIAETDVASSDAAVSTRAVRVLTPSTSRSSLSSSGTRGRSSSFLESKRRADRAERAEGTAAGLLNPKIAKLRGDNASVMTIASSSKRRRRSLDTNASTRALAAESIRSDTASVAPSLAASASTSVASAA